MQAAAAAAAAAAATTTHSINGDFTQLIKIHENEYTEYGKTVVEVEGGLGLRCDHLAAVVHVKCCASRRDTPFLL
jgi:hypothetical protein